MLSHSFWSILVAALALAGPVHAQSTGAPSTKSAANDAKGKDAGKLSKDDRKFMETVTRDNLTEIQAGKLAQSNAFDARVKKLGQMMEQDHTKANQELQKIASEKGVSLPSDPSKSQARLLKDLQGKNGADFDKAFAKATTKDHKKAVKLFDKTRKNAKDPDVRAFADKTYAAINSHLQMAREISGEGSANKGPKSSKNQSDGK
jgi:putative membrane protein